MLHVIIATRNRHKFRELKTLLALPGVRYHSLVGIPGIGNIPEHGRTFDANAMTKARTVARKTGQLAVADDSGLEVAALHGAPGVHSARFAGVHGDDAANNRKLLRLLQGLPTRRRRARYRCSLALASPTRTIAVVRGSWSGRIAPRPAGRGGFGYDPIFAVPTHGRTVGQLPVRTKQLHSHRAAAARRLRPILKQLLARQRRSR